MPTQADISKRKQMQPNASGYTQIQANASKRKQMQADTVKHRPSAQQFYYSVPYTNTRAGH